ncbi:MAG: DUF4190 domain-containing protein [Tepidisphaeraceae bacterium]
MSDEQRPAPVAPVVVDYSTPRPHNRNASRALIFGLLGFLPFVPGIIAIVSARRGLRDLEADPRVGGKAAAKAGLWLGVGSIVAWVALSIAAVPATIQAQRQAIRVQCMSQLRQIGQGVMIYAASNKGHLGINVLFADGHVEVYSGADPHKFLDLYGPGGTLVPQPATTPTVER